MEEEMRTRSFPRYIPHDMMVQILSRLPVKFLLRFKCVCKHWQSIICDAEFGQLRRTSSETRLDSKYFVNFRYYHYKDRIFISFKNFNGSSEAASPIELKVKVGRHILSSEPLDGLVCLYTRYPINHALVLNLSTRQIVQLPKPKNAFDDNFCSYFLGFDPRSRDYKVLRYSEEVKHWRRKMCTLERSCEIYTLGTPSWRKICGPPGALQCHASGACVNGTVYWLALEYNNRCVIAFDVGKEVFRTIRFTPSDYSCLFAVGGQLVTTRMVNNGDLIQNKIGFAFLEGWDRNEVSVKEDIDFPANLEQTIGLRVSGVSPTGEIVFTDKFSSRNVICYHLRKKTWREDEWPQPLENDPSDPRPELDQYFRSVCVENIVRLKDHDSVRNPDHNFLIE